MLIDTAPDFSGYRDAARKRYEAEAPAGWRGRLWVAWMMHVYTPANDPHVPAQLREWKFYDDAAW